MGGGDAVVANAEVMLYALLAVVVLAGMIAAVVVGLRRREGTRSREDHRQGHGRAP